jgi:hypothetical protein
VCADWTLTEKPRQASEKPAASITMNALIAVHPACGPTRADQHAPTDPQKQRRDIIELMPRLA